MLRRALFGSLVLLVLGASAAWARSIEVEAFHVQVEVRPDGVVAVEERITYRFVGSFRGVYRDIPYGYKDASGVRGMIQLDLVAVEDDAGTPLEHWTKRRGGYLKVKIAVPGAHDAMKTVVIRYEAQNVVRERDHSDLDFGVQDELYWDVTGNESPIPVHEVVADVRLPEGIPHDLIRVRAFTGRLGAEGDAFVAERADDGSIRFRTTRSLHPYEGLTVVIAFPPGHVAYPTTLQKLGWWFRANWYVLLPFVLLALAFLAWWAWGRDPMSGRTIVPDWRPPDDLRASEVGVLADDRLDQRDLTAGIVGLAVRGVITIHEEEDDSYRLELHPERRAKTDLDAYEKRLLEELFEEGETETELGAHKYGFVKSLGRIRDSILDHLVGTGYFPSRPDRVMGRWSGWTFLVMLGLVILGFALQLPLPYWVACASCIVPMFVLARYMPRRTAKGLDALARIRGMEEYLVTAEKERMKTLPMDHFEAVLPYAIALGVDDRWAKAFEGVFDEPPDWYRSRRSGFDSLWLWAGLSSMNRSVGSNLMSGPRSSGSSGWGGTVSGGGGFSGGFSGGGFGGGGTGGW